METKEKQNIFDVTLNAYGGLDFIIHLANDNGFVLDEIPPKQEIIKNDTIGIKNVKIYVIEHNYYFVNEAIEKTAVLLIADNTALSPSDNVQFIYK